MSRAATKIATLALVAAGWLAVVATSPSDAPVEHVDLEVELAIGPAAPSTAVVDVVFEGAFIDQRNRVCAFMWGPVAGSADVPRDIRVLIEPLGPLGETVTVDGDGWLEEVTAPLPSLFLQPCAQVTCGAEEPCGGRFAITLVDAASSDAGVDPTRFDPLPIVVAAVTTATPGALAGRATITLVETQP